MTRRHVMHGRSPLWNFARDGRLSVDRAWVAVPLLALLMLTPTILHGQPFLFIDTEAYFDYGKRIFRPIEEMLTGAGDRATDTGAAEAVSAARPASESEGANAAEGDERDLRLTYYGARSPYYSVFSYAVAMASGYWGVILVQTLAIAWLLWRCVALAGIGQPGLAAMAIAAVATLTSTAWFAAGFAMPDAFAPAALLAVAFIVVFRRRASAADLLIAAAILLVSMIFHRAHMLIVIATAAVAIAVAYAMGREPLSKQWRPAAIVAGTVLLSMAGMAAFDAGAKAVFGMSPKRPPFLMARVLADGPGRVLLAERCAEDERAFAVCAYRDRKFVHADEFLWGGDPTMNVYMTIPFDERMALLDEELRFVAEAVANEPVMQLKASLHNALYQLHDIWPVEAWYEPSVEFSPLSQSSWGKDRMESFVEAAPFLSACLSGGSCAPAVPVELVNGLITVSFAIALLIVGVHLHNWFVTPREDGHDAVVLLALVIVAGLLVNAFVSGALSAPHPRYQARVLWLAVFAAGLLEAYRPLVLRWLRGLALRAFSRSA